MGRFDLKPTRTRRAVPNVSVEPEVIPASSDRLGQQSGAATRWLSAGLETAPAALEIAKMVVSSKCDVEKIRATSDAEVRRIAADIDRIAAESRAYVEKTKAEASAWHSKFDSRMSAKKELVDRVMAALDSHPEWTDAIKSKIIDLALSFEEVKG